MGKRILITGATGFIGRNLVEKLSPGYSIFAPQRRELDLLDDASVAAFFRSTEVEAVIHCATTAAHRNARPPDDVAFRNLRMYFNLLRHDDRWSRLFILGSGSEYDLRNYSPKMTEEWLGRSVPADPSGFSKFVISTSAESHSRVTVLRIFGAYGKHEDWEIRFISNALCKALFDRPITIRQNRRFDYLWVDDLAPVIEYFVANEPVHRSYNVTPDRSEELLALAQMVLVVAGKEHLPIKLAEAGMGSEYSGDNQRLRRAIPGLTFTPPMQGIARLWEWYSANRDRIRPDALDLDK